MATSSYHKRWIGALEAVGLVVSPTALDTAELVVDRNIVDTQQALAPFVDTTADDNAAIVDFVGFARAVFGWSPALLAGAPGGPPLPESLDRALPEFTNDRLHADFAVLLPASRRASYAPHAAKYPVADAELAVMVLPRGTSLDAPQGVDDGHRWWASPQQRMERLLRESGVMAGLLCNGTQLRLVAAPVGESSGSLTWPVVALTRVDGRELLAALRMLLEQSTIVGNKADRRLTAVLRDSRLYQNEVSTRLARQVLGALNELVDGWQAAVEREASRAELGRIEVDTLFEGLLAVILRLVFLLYSEERGMMPSGELYTRHYSVIGLFEQLREDAGRHPDTINERFGAWARLCVLFRLVHDGSTRGELSMPARQGRLFDPDSWPFIEGRVAARQAGERLDLPRVSDGVVFRVLDNLLMLRDSDNNRERLSYRALDVEHLGSVYEGMTGFGLKRLDEVVARHHDIVLGVTSLVAAKATERSRLLKAAWGGTPPASVRDAAAKARTVDEFFELAAKARLERLEPGALCVVPTHGRRSSGSHYTPRELTGPIVREALRPHLDGLGGNPTPQQILALRVCDPAMGSGAFLVETVRQLGEVLERAWLGHGVPAEVRAEADRTVAARRVVAQRCVYGIDLNAFAVDLAKLSLWLITLSREHAFTFVDHALRHGDSLVGLGRDEIVAAITSAKASQPGLLTRQLEKRLEKALRLRAEAAEKPFDDNTAARRRALRDAIDELDEFELVGDALVAERFAKAAGNKVYSTGAAELGRRLVDDDEPAARSELMARAAWLRSLPRPVPPLHWELVFPEVFARENGGFDVIVGNPPFLGGTRISTEFGMPYFAYLVAEFPPAGHLCDLCGFFFRRAFDRLNSRGSFGLIATNTIAQGDTREGALLPLLSQGGLIYGALRATAWPGLAAVIVSTVHVARSSATVIGVQLDGKEVDRISAFLVEGHTDHTPPALIGTPYWSLGVKIYGQGFVFDDADPKASLGALADSISIHSPAEGNRISGYIGGEELNTVPDVRPTRRVFNLSDLQDEDALRHFPHLAAIAAEKVLPERLLLGENPNNTPLKRRWWAYQAHRPALFAAMRGTARVLAISRVTSHISFAWLPTNIVPSEQVVVIVLDHDSAFAALNSRIHVLWALTFQSSMKDDTRYTPSTCFENFPFPANYETDAALNDVGERYNTLRAHIMKTRWEGLTKTYNRFHDPAEQSDDIVALRALHAEMDQAVLDAYGWSDLRPVAAFYSDDGRPWDTLDEEERAELRKRDVRLRWSPPTEAEVLARLLKLHGERYAEEVRLGLHAKAPRPKAAKAVPRVAKSGASPRLQPGDGGDGGDDGDGGDGGDGGGQGRLL